MPQPTPGTPNPAATVPAAAPGAATTPASMVPPTQAQPTPAATPQAPAQPASPAPAQPPAGQPGMVPLPALQEERTRRQALEAEVEQLKRQMSTPQAPQQPVVQQVDPREELNRLWDTDPRKAVQVEIMYAMDWRDRQDAALNAQADQLAMKYQDFNNHRSSALAYVRSLPAHQRGAPGVLEASYYMVRGQNLDQLMQQRENEWLEKYRRGEVIGNQLLNPAGGYSAPQVITQGIQLNADQLKVAEAMGLTPEQYASQIKLTPTGAR